jgi:hypothetical protein
MAKIPHADQGQTCPFNGKDTSEVCHKCPMWFHIRGTDQNTGDAVDDWRCAFAWLPMLLIENSAMQRQTGAAVESHRNEAVKAAEVTCKVIAAAAGMRQAPTQIEAAAHPQIAAK